MPKILCPDHGFTPVEGCCSEEKFKISGWAWVPSSTEEVPHDSRRPMTNEDWEALLGDKE